MSQKARTYYIFVWIRFCEHWAAFSQSNQVDNVAAKKSSLYSEGVVVERNESQPVGCSDFRYHTFRILFRKPPWCHNSCYFHGIIVLTIIVHCGRYRLSMHIIWTNIFFDDWHAQVSDSHLNAKSISLHTNIDTCEAQLKIAHDFIEKVTLPAVDI